MKNVSNVYICMVMVVEFLSEAVEIQFVFAVPSHSEIRLRNGKGIIGLWKKYILLYKCRQNQLRKNF